MRPDLQAQDANWFAEITVNHQRPDTIRAAAAGEDEWDEDLDEESDADIDDEYDDEYDEYDDLEEEDEEEETHERRKYKDYDEE